MEKELKDKILNAVFSPLDENRLIEQERESFKECEHSIPYLKCPKCHARALALWKIYGVCYYKCDHCGYKTNNL